MTQSTVYSQTSPAFSSHPCGIAKWPLNTAGSLFDRCTGLTNLMQLNLSTMSTSGTEASGRCKEVAIVERFWIRVNVWIFCLPGQKQLAVVERWLLTCREVAVSRGSNCSFSRKYRRWLSEISTTFQVDLKVFLPLLGWKKGSKRSPNAMHTDVSIVSGADLGGGCRRCAPPPPLRWPAAF